MKTILIILVVFLTACSASKESLDNTVNQEIISDTISTTIDDENDVNRKKSEIVEEMQIIKDKDIEKKDEIMVIEQHEKKTKLKVIDKTTTVADTNKGWIAFSIPEEMKVQKNYSVKVRISKKSNQSKAELILGNDDAINNPEYPSIAIVEDVKVSGEMSAELRGDSDEFKIVSLSTPTQNIDNESYTEWEWIVTPLSSGQSPLKLIIKVKDLNKDIVVFNRSIKIKSNVPVAVESFFDKYWQWFMTTIIIPIFLYFWNKKRKRKQTKKS